MVWHVVTLTLAAGGMGQVELPTLPRSAAVRVEIYVNRKRADEESTSPCRAVATRGSVVVDYNSCTRQSRGRVVLSGANFGKKRARVKLRWALVG